MWLIIPLQTAGRTPPAEVAGLKLDLFLLKEQICPETRAFKVIPHKVLWNLKYKCSVDEILVLERAEVVCFHVLQNC